MTRFLACLFAISLSVNFAVALPDRPASTPEPPPVAPRCCNYGHAVVTFDGENLTIDEIRYFGCGRASEEGSIPIVWTDKEKGEVTHIGMYWFAECGDLFGVWSMIGYEHQSPSRYHLFNVDCAGVNAFVSPD